MASSSFAEPSASTIRESSSSFTDTCGVVCVELVAVLIVVFVVYCCTLVDIACAATNLCRFALIPDCPAAARCPPAGSGPSPREGDEDALDV